RSGCARCRSGTRACRRMRPWPVRPATATTSVWGARGTCGEVWTIADSGASGDAGTQRSRRGSMPRRQPGALARVSSFWHDAARGRGYTMFASLVLGAVLSAAMPLAAGGGAGQAGAAAASAAPGTGLLPTPQFRHYDTGDGLPSSAINAVVQDERGFMWFGGSGGLVRYDGVSSRPTHTRPATRIPCPRPTSPSWYAPR